MLSLIVYLALFGCTLRVAKWALHPLIRIVRVLFTGALIAGIIRFIRNAFRCSN